MQHVGSSPQPVTHRTLYKYPGSFAQMARAELFCLPEFSSGHEPHEPTVLVCSETRACLPSLFCPNCLSQSSSQGLLPPDSGKLRGLKHFVLLKRDNCHTLPARRAYAQRVISIPQHSPERTRKFASLGSRSLFQLRK
jgi:hypothetical protein